MNKTFIAAISFALLMVFHGNAGASSTHVVYKAGQTSCTTGDYYYNTIQEAVEAAGPVDSVIICPAGEADPYVENVIAYKGWGDSKQGFSIVAFDEDPGNTVVQAADPNQHVFYFAGGGVHNMWISGLTIKGATGGSPASPCQVCPNGNCFDDTQPYCAGIRIFCTENGYITRNYITGNHHGIIIKDTAAGWVFLTSIMSNYIYDNNVGVKLQYGNNSLLFSNYFLNNSDIGIHLLDTWSNEFSNNIIENSSTNIRIERDDYDASSNLFYMNDVINSPGVSLITDDTYPDCLNQWYKKFKPGQVGGNYWSEIPQPVSCYDSFSSASPVTQTNIHVLSLSSPSTAYYGETVTVTDVNRNLTAIPVTITTKTAFYLSTDNKYSGGDTYLGERSLSSIGPLRKNEGNTAITIPPGTAPGNYYIIAYADRYNVLCESDEGPDCNDFYWSNNFKTSTAITITDPPAWPYRQRITIGSSMTLSDLTDYPVLIKLSDQNNPVFNNAQADGDDIFFTASDGSARLDHEVEYYQNAGTKELDAWVRIPLLSASADTVIYMYYGNGSAANQENAGAVWDSNHVMVQHLSEHTGQHLDSTVNNNDSNQVNVIQQGQTTEAVIGGADEFGTDNVIIIPDAGVDSPLDLSGGGSVTLSAWVYATGTGESPGNQAGIIEKSESGSGYTLRVDGWNCTSYGDYTAVGSFPGNWSPVCSGATPNNIRQGGQAGWYHVVFVYDSVTFDQHLYINGVKDAEGNWGALTSGDTVRDLQIGAWYTASFEGYIDEVRISNTARSEAWINTSHKNQSSPGNYLTFGVEEIN